MNINPSDSLESISAAVREDIKKETLEKNEIPEIEAVQEKVYKEMLTALKKASKDIIYEKAVTVKVHVSCNKQGNYEIRDGDMEKVIQNLFAYHVKK